MKRDEHEIKVAWEIWNLISRLNDLIWDFYENDFMELLKKSTKNNRKRMHNEINTSD